MSIQDIVDFSQANTAPDRYRPAAEKILKGDPEQTVYNHYNSPCGQMSAGVWEGEVGQWTVNYTEHEYCEIVQGVSVLRDAEGNAKTLRAGDRFVIPGRVQRHLGSAGAMPQDLRGVRTEGLISQISRQKKARLVRDGLFFTRKKINYLILPSL